MIDCILIDGKTRDSEYVEGFNSFMYALGKNLSRLLDIPQFKSVKFLTATPIVDEYRHENIEYLSITPLTFNDYQNFAMFKLHELCKHDFIMTCQGDGWPLNFEKWDDRFLDYDFIGAPWPKELFKDHIRGYYAKQEKIEIDTDEIPDHWVVGNSGFCIRSKRMMELCASTNFPIHLCPWHGNHFTTKPNFDDWYFSFAQRPFFELRGIKYAPPDLASNFSLEALVTGLVKQPLATRYTKSGDRYIANHLSPKEVLEGKLSFGIHGDYILKEFFKKVGK